MRCSKRQTAVRYWHWGREVLLLPVYRQRELILQRGKGARLWDNEGRDYVDFWRRNRGVQPGPLQSRVECCADRTSRQTLAYQQCVLQRTAAAAGAGIGGGLAFCRARISVQLRCRSQRGGDQIGAQMGQRARPSAGQRTIITFHGSFHGRTGHCHRYRAAQISVRLRAAAGGFRYVDFNDIPALDAAMAAGDVAAVMLEPVQGESGVIPAAAGYLQAVRALCDRHAALFGAG